MTRAMALASWDVLVEPSAESRQESVARNRLHSQRYDTEQLSHLSEEMIDQEDNLMTLVFKSLESLDNLEVWGLADILEASIARRLQRLWSLLTSNRAENLVERLENMSTEQRRLLLGRVALEQVASIAESVDLLTKRGQTKWRENGGVERCAVCCSGSESLAEKRVGSSIAYRPRSRSSPESLQGVRTKSDNSREHGNSDSDQASIDATEGLLTNLCLHQNAACQVVEQESRGDARVSKFRGGNDAKLANVADPKSSLPHGGRATCGKVNGETSGSDGGSGRSSSSWHGCESTERSFATCSHKNESSMGIRRMGEGRPCEPVLGECEQGKFLRDAMGRCLSSENLVPCGGEQVFSASEGAEVRSGGGLGGRRGHCEGVMATEDDAGVGRLGSTGWGPTVRGNSGVEEWEDADAAFMLLLLTENKEKHSDRRLALHLEYMEGFYGFPVENVGVILEPDMEEEEKGEALRTEGWRERLQEGLMQNLLHLGLNVSGLVGPGSNLPASIRHYVDTIGCFQRLVRALKANEPVPRTGAPPAAASVITRLPSVIVSASHISEGAGQCSICRERLRVSTRATQVPCGHLFHVDCILPWLRRRNSCPVCRFELPTDDLDYELLRRRRGIQSASARF